MNVAELRDKLAEAHNFASALAADNPSDHYSAYYSGRADALVWVLDQLNNITQSQEANA